MLFDEEHFWKVVKYIERNALVLGLVDDITKWKYQSLYLRLNKTKFNEIIEGSKIYTKPINEYVEWLNKPFEKFELDEIYNEPKIIKMEDGSLKVIRKKIADFFNEYKDKAKAIKEAKKAGYKYTEIARYLGVSNGYIQKILRSSKEE